MTWAEAWGIGELGLSPREFWSLTYREFELKREAFVRAEDRFESALIHQALRTTHYDARAKNRLSRAANALKRYPVKSWLK